MLEQEIAHEEMLRATGQASGCGAERVAIRSIRFFCMFVCDAILTYFPLYFLFSMAKFYQDLTVGHLS